MSGMSVAGAGGQRPASAFAGITAPKPGFLFHAFGIRSRRFMHNLREAIKEDARNRLNVTDPREVKEIMRLVLDRMGVSSLSQVEAGSQRETQKNLTRLGHALNASSVKASIEGERAKQLAGEAFDAHLGVPPDNGSVMGMFTLHPRQRPERQSISHDDVVEAIRQGFDAAFPDAQESSQGLRVEEIVNAVLKRRARVARFDGPQSSEKILKARNKLLGMAARLNAASVSDRIMQAFPNHRRYDTLVVETVLARLAQIVGKPSLNAGNLTDTDRMELERLLGSTEFKAKIIREVEDAAQGGDFPASWEEVAVPDGPKA